MDFGNLSIKAFITNKLSENYNKLTVYLNFFKKICLLNNLNFVKK